MIHGLLEAVSLVFIIGLTILLPILIYRAAPPAPNRDDERRQMRDERRRPPERGRQ